MHRNFLCKEKDPFKQGRGFLQAVWSVHVAILISSNFSKFYTKSFKIKAPRHTQYKVTRHCRTALRRQIENLSLSSGIHIPFWSCILPRLSGRSPGLHLLLHFPPKTGSHIYTPSGTVPWQPSMLHTTLFLWQFLSHLQDHRNISVVPFNMLFKLEDTTATKQEDFKCWPCNTQVNMKEISKNPWWHIGYYCVSTPLPTASHTSQGCHFNSSESSSSQ